MESINDRIEDILLNIDLTRYSPINGDKTEPSGITGFPTGFAEIDKLTCGFQRGELILFSAYQQMGKTAFLLSMINNNRTDCKSIIYFSTRLSADQIIKRLICNLTRTELHNLQGGFVDDDFADSVKNMYKSTDLFIDDTVDLDYETMCKLIEDSELISPSLIIVDDINTLNISTSNNHTETIVEKLVMLKKVAKRYRTPVLTVHQLEIPKLNPDKVHKHQLHRIDNSPVDIYLSLYRPEYFRIVEDEEGNSLVRKAEFLIQGTGVLNDPLHRDKPLCLNYDYRYFLFSDNV